MIVAASGVFDYVQTTGDCSAGPPGSSTQTIVIFGRLTGLFVAVFSTALALFWASYDPPRVNVRWREGVTPSMRAALEAQHRLTEPRHEDGATWSYTLSDASAENIRRLVQNPGVEDTHHIDRSKFEGSMSTWSN